MGSLTRSLVLILLLAFVYPRGAVAQGNTAGETFDTGDIDEDQISGAILFPEVGSYNYICTPHEGLMDADIVISDDHDVVNLTIYIEGFEYFPAQARIGPGSHLQWQNNDSDTHTATGILIGSDVHQEEERKQLAGIIVGVVMVVIAVVYVGLMMRSSTGKSEESE